MHRNKPSSLQARLAWRLAAVFLIAATVAFGGLTWRAVTTIDSLEDRSLQAQARDLERHLKWHPDRGQLDLELPPSLAASYDRWSDAFVYAVYGPEGEVLAASSATAAALFERRLPADPPAFFRIDQAEAQPYYGYLQAIGPLRLAVAQGRLHDDVLIDSLVEEFLEANAWWLLVLVLAAVLVGVITIRRSLAPVAAVSAQAARIGPGSTGTRLVEDDLPREVRPLVAAVNQALDRLEQGFEIQRQFTTDAAHELRTPLAILTARIDGLPRSETSAGLRRDVARLNRLVEQLLRVARMDAVPLDVTQTVDLREVAQEVLSDLAPRALRERRSLVLSGIEGPLWVRGNEAALSAAVANLVENALSHTPPGSGIEVELLAGGALRVRDHGPGVPAAERELIFRRFHRGRGAPPGGAGLGLAVVAQTARLHGGRVEVEAAPGGGACFTLRLPAAPPPRGPAAAGSERTPDAA